MQGGGGANKGERVIRMTVRWLPCSPEEFGRNNWKEKGWDRDRGQVSGGHEEFIFGHVVH